MSGKTSPAARPLLTLATAAANGGSQPRVEPVAHARASLSRVPLRPLPAHHATTALAPAGAEHLLSREHLLAQLHREKRRVDRSKAPLSLVVYRMAQRSDGASTSALASLLVASKRETDIAGWIADDAIAVVCPDTGGTGAQRFIEKIERISADLPYSVECATYPDHLFDAIATTASPSTEPIDLLASGPSRTRVYWLKRPLDILGALLAIVLFAPIMLAAAVAVRLSSPGPVIFRQTRLGRFGVPFTFYKFRSMRVDNDDRIHRDFVKNLIEGNHDRVERPDGKAALYKIKTDPRVTRVGRLIRLTSIDELPQLFNVLKGDMSLVGPRPPLRYEVENYDAWHLRRVLDIRPGITGLWQVEGRGKLPFAEMVRMDLRYIEQCSLAVDLRILARTVPVVLSCDGAS